MKKIAILLLDGVMDSSLAITLDCLQAAQSIAAVRTAMPQVQIQTITIKTCVMTGCGLSLRGDLRLRAAQVDVFDWIIVPGLGVRSGAEIAERLMRQDAVQAMQYLAHTGNGKSRIAASCSAVFLLAEAGLLRKLRASTSWWLAPVFRARYPDVLLDEGKMLISDGRCLTAGAALSQMDLMLTIIADVMGKSVANLCSRYLLIDQRSSQARYMMHNYLLHQDEMVIAAERWIDDRLAKPITVKALAAALAVSAKTLARHIEAATGVSPIKFIQRRRLLHATHFLETSELSIEEVAARVGYQDSTALRKLIKREFGVTPGALR